MHLIPCPPCRRPQANGLAATAAAEELAWGAPVGHLQPPFDVVLASDVLYLAEALPAFVETLVQLCGPHTQVRCARQWAKGVVVCGSTGGKTAGRAQTACPRVLGRA